MKKITILTATIAAAMTSAQAATVYTQTYDSFNLTERDNTELGGANPNVGFNEVFRPTNGVSITSGILNFTGNTNGRGVGVWADSSTWGAGTVTVTYDISNFAAGNDATSSTLQIYSATGVNATNAAIIDIQTGGLPIIGGLTTAVASAAITADGSGISFTFTNVAGTDATAFVFNNDTGNIYSVDNLSVDAVVIPEPSSSALISLAGLAFLTRRARK